MRAGSPFALIFMQFPQGLVRLLPPAPASVLAWQPLLPSSEQAGPRSALGALLRVTETVSPVGSPGSPWEMVSPSQRL